MIRRTIRGCAAALLLAVSVLSLPAAPALAQDTLTVTPATPPGVAMPDPTPEQLAAALDYLRASGATRGFEDMIPQFLDQIRLRYVTQRPEIAQMINDSAFALIPEFVKRRDDLNQQIAKLYTQRFSEDELKQLAEFYRSALGQKLASQQIEVLQQSVPLVQAWSRKLTEDMALRVKDEVKKKGQRL